MVTEAIRIERLFLNFGGLQVLRDLSLTIGVGEYLAIIGPNGAGKTTLLNIIDGQLSPTSGRVCILGEDISNLPIYSRVHLGLTRSFQITRLFSNLTVLENVLLSIHGIEVSRFQMYRSNSAYDEAIAKAQNLLEMVDLWKKRDDLIRAISYGEQRKMEIILSLASSPKILLLDEPTAGLDISEVPAFINMIKTLAKGTTLLFIAHDMDVVFGLANRVVVLYFGHIIADGTPQEIQVDPTVREVYLGIEEEKPDAEVG